MIKPVHYALLAGLCVGIVAGFLGLRLWLYQISEDIAHQNAFGACLVERWCEAGATDYCQALEQSR